MIFLRFSEYSECNNGEGDNNKRVSECTVLYCQHTTSIYMKYRTGSVSFSSRGTNCRNFICAKWKTKNHTGQSTCTAPASSRVHRQLLSPGLQELNEVSIDQEVSGKHVGNMGQGEAPARYNIDPVHRSSTLTSLCAGLGLSLACISYLLEKTDRADTRAPSNFPVGQLLIKLDLHNKLSGVEALNDFQTWGHDRVRNRGTNYVTWTQIRRHR